MYTVYNLNISELQTALEVPDNTPPHVFTQKLEAALIFHPLREKAEF